MSRLTRITLVSLALALAAGALLLASLKLPLWQMRMESPQYREEEALRVTVFANSMVGDINEIKVLNQYIGVTLPEPPPHTRWLPHALLAGAVLGLIAAVLPLVARRRALLTIAAALLLSLVAGAAQAQWEMYKLGHDRAEKTILRGVKDFTPPIVGRKKIENFVVTSWFGIGSYAVGGAVVLQIIAAWTARNVQPSCRLCGKASDPAASHDAHDHAAASHKVA